MKNSALKIIAILFVTSIFTSCNVDMFNRVNGNKNVITEERKTSDNFTGIKVSTGLDLYISQGSKNKISVEADENLHEIIKTEVENGVLKIYSEKNIGSAKARKVYVTITDLETLIATSGSDVYTEDVIKTNTISISTTSGANIKFSVNATSVETSSTSGSNIKIEGITTNYTASATSGSSTDAYNLESENTIAKVTSGADINVFASEKLEAKATSGGDIDYKGNPRQLTKKATSGGSISAH